MAEDARLRREKPILACEERRKQSQRNALQRALLLFDEEFPEESNRLRTESIESQGEEGQASHEQPRENVGEADVSIGDEIGV